MIGVRFMPVARQNPFATTMKLVILAAAAATALLSASCCPSAAPATTPTYVAPTK
jgi:hypothetical protein